MMDDPVEMEARAIGPDVLEVFLICLGLLCVSILGALSVLLWRLALYLQF